MATRSGKLSKPDRQGFARQLGFKINSAGKRVQHKFRLGRDHTSAEARAALLRQVWKVVEMRMGEDSALWDEQTLAIALQVAKGVNPVLVPAQKPDEQAQEYCNRIQSTRDQFPFLTIEPKPSTTPIAIRLRQLREDHQAIPGVAHAAAVLRGVTSPDPSIDKATQATQSPSAVVSTATLYQSISAYEERIREHYHDVATDQISDYGRTRLDQWKSLRARHEDRPLSKIDLNEIESMYRYWQRRPESRAKGTLGKPIAVSSARHYIGELKKLFKWLHHSSDFGWRKPEGFEEIDTTIQVNTNDVKKSIRQVRTFQLEELCHLNRFATPRERAYLMLGLNCGFAPKEISTLTIGECFLNQGLPQLEQEICDYQSSSNQSFISFVRNKTTIYGKFLLFRQTADMLQWVMQHRITQPNPTDEQPVFLNANNKPLDHRNNGGSPSRKIANAFSDLKKRCEFNEHPVTDLPFKCLRKTAGDLIRRFSDGEIAGVFLLHGTPVKSDHLSDVYTNRPFGKVYRAIEEVEKYLQPVFAEAPFPTVEQSQAYTPRSKIERIAEMHAAGRSVREIESVVGLSKSTVHRHIKRLKTQQT